MNRITFKQYRSIDLAMFTILTMVFEAVTTVATNRWFYAQPVALSVTLALVCITMMRWGGFAAIPAVVGAFVFCVASGATIEQYLIYCIGNLGALAALLVTRLFEKEKVRTGTGKLALFGFVAYVGMVLGRWLVSLLYGGDLMAFAVYATTDIITLLFTMVILFLFRRTDGMMEDQKAYLFRMERERKEEAERFVPEEEEY